MSYGTYSNYGFIAWLGLVFIVIVTTFLIVIFGTKLIGKFIIGRPSMNKRYYSFNCIKIRGKVAVLPFSWPFKLYIDNCGATLIGVKTEDNPLLQMCVLESRNKEEHKERLEIKKMMKGLSIIAKVKRLTILKNLKN